MNGLTHQDARDLLLNSGCFRSGQGWVIDLPIEQFIPLISTTYLKYLQNQLKEKKED